MKIFLRVLKYAKPYKFRIAIGICMMIIVSACSAGAMYMLKPLFDKGLKQGDPQAGWETLKIALVLLGLYSIKGLAFYVQDYIMNNAGQKMIMDIRSEVYNHVQKLSLRYFASHRTGQIISRITSDVVMMQQAVGLTSGIIGNGMNFIGLLIVVFTMNWQLSLISMAASVLIIFPLYNFGKRLRNISLVAQDKIGEITSVTYEGISNIRIVKGFAMENHELSKFNRASRAYFDTFMKSIRVTALSHPVIEFIGILAISIIIVISGFQIGKPDSHITVGSFAAFTGALFLLFNPIRNLNGVNISIQQALSSSERVFELLDEKLDVADDPKAVRLPGFEKSLEFKDVCFEYTSGKPVLKNINLKINKGEVVAVVGPSGSGKSTMVDLIPRFYDASSGILLVDGMDIRQLTLTSLRAQVGIVTQETILFNDSIRDNIAYGRKDEGQAEVEAAAKAANAHAFILKTPKGYDTFIGERGVKLSGGERQRLSIARAILKNPPVLILDEATSALDTESEKLVQEALENLMKNRTTVVIAHRLSTVVNADKIVVLKDGVIESVGRHAELLGTSATYKKLYEMQFAVERSV